MSSLRLFSSRSTATIAALAAMGMVAASCSSGASDESGSAASSTAAAKGPYVRAVDTEPLGRLVPQDSNDVAGLKVLLNVFTGLFTFDKDGQSHPGAAESVTASDNNATFTVTLKEGQVFADGTPVTAESFTKAWSFANEHDYTNAHYYKHFKGYQEGKPLPEEGLKVVDERTFVIHLDQSQVDFPVQLGHPAFFPLPEAALKDIEAFGAKPFGNGPYKVEKWDHEKEILMVPNDKYEGERTPKNSGVDFLFFPTQESAYTALLSGDVDIVDDLPDSAYATYKKDLDGRYSNQTAATLESLHIPERLPHFGGKEGKLRRAALSLAIDRKTIADKIFDGTVTPPKDFSTPVVGGHGQDLDGVDVLSFDPERAKKLWAEADALSPWDGTFTIAYNADAGHQAWVNAVINSINTTLGVDAKPNPYPDFKSMRSEVVEGTLQGAYRGSWSSSYPSVLSFIGNRYISGDATQVGWKNEEFEQQLEDAATSKSAEDAQKHYDKAQEIMLQDLPSIPLWNKNAVTGWGPDVTNVIVDWTSLPLYYDIETTTK